MTTTTPIADVDDLAARLVGVGLFVTRAGAQLLEIASGAGTICLRWDDRLPLVHAVCALFGSLTHAGTAAVESMVARWNHDLPLPGLGVDRDGGHIYFRCVVVRAPGGIVLDELLAMLALLVDQLHGLRPTMEDVLRVRTPSPARDAGLLQLAERFAA